MLVHLKTLGCRLNEAELETWAQAFQRAGHGITQQVQSAQLVVINSCAVTHDAARKSRNLIRRIHRDNPRAKLVVSGCYATLKPEEASALLGVDLVVSNGDKDQLVTKALTELVWDTMPYLSTEPGQVSLFTRGRQRAFVKVQDGCRYRCTYCIVTVARGDEVSRPISAIIDEINALYAQGVHEVILTGVHLGGYGSDLQLNLVDLIKAVLAQTPIPRLRLGSLEPWEFSGEFFELFQYPRLMPHLHLPLQSGADAVLKRMARRTSTREFALIVSQLREKIADFNITTDIIVGFPGESEQEWQDSLDFIQSVGFGHIHIFTYSQREGTRATTLAGQIPDAVKKQRSQQLHILAETMRRQFYQANLGKRFAVLWEGYNETLANNQQRVFGYTPNYLRVAGLINAGETVENKTLPVVLTTAEDEYISTEWLASV